jgi:menaquinone-specific isochorismate synthase
VVKTASAGLRYETRPLSCAGDLLSLTPDRGALVYLEHPARGEALLASGIAVEVRANGPRRFADAAHRLRALFQGAHGEAAPGPFAVGGFAFEDEQRNGSRWRAFGSLSLVVPRRAWWRRGDRIWQIDVEHEGALEHEPPSPAATPLSIENPFDDRAAWRRRVAAALEAIASGTLRKVVLARERTVVVSPDLDPRDVVRRLRDERPACTTFWVRRGSQSFVGSSPELLARVAGRTVEAVALAGTAAARSAAEEVAAARALLDCAKNAAEHRLVAAEIETALRAVCDELEVSERSVERVPEALHLATRFRGVLGSPLCALEVAGLLHPTSAVCGLPRSAARALIATTEAERGWYAGGIGWVDGAGNGEFAVALRCGLLETGDATLWAGAGIVTGSQPDAEYDETATKMQAMVRSLELAQESAHAGGGDAPRRNQAVA